MIRTRFYVATSLLAYSHDIVVLAVHSHAITVDLHVHVIQRVAVALLQATHVLQQSVIHLAIAVHRLILLVVLTLESARQQSHRLPPLSVLQRRMTPLLQPRRLASRRVAAAQNETLALLLRLQRVVLVPLDLVHLLVRHVSLRTTPHSLPSHALVDPQSRQRHALLHNHVVPQRTAVQLHAVADTRPAHDHAVAQHAAAADRDVVADHAAAQLTALADATARAQQRLRENHRLPQRAVRLHQTAMLHARRVVEQRRRVDVHVATTVRHHAVAGDGVVGNRRVAESTHHVRTDVAVGAQILRERGNADVRR